MPSFYIEIDFAFLQRLADPLSDLIGSQTVLTDNFHSLAGSSELIIDTDLAELAADFAH